jgi:transposase
MTVYSETSREEWRQKLPQDQTLLLIVEGLWNQLKESEQTEKNLLKAARSFAKHYPEIKLFEDIPGIGFISAATISAILETPHRLPIKERFGCMQGWV